ncbi:heavy metal translocating P-type ATPase [Pseudobacteriovorax antillogorgiicola]|uniref:Cu+-exporting ATPase n=1 Tax=Pseudobacteriovorax antillogorgiicola TaxID=1513793 RepID=A0A1Y6CLI8_9BACT|nr:cation-translocating P-type ATPase [Pseudobacteriovorax antillogorgiicola]TCS47967.1 Cu+-exporting ATPase [Pseudobacteriovorax antillogorgiicola]SMF58210.1 Cu+-exporting ATPase [Pseudobacteriovorax antillogorgiicola]
MKQHHIKLSGMTCTACSARIEKVLNRKPNIQSAVVNYASETARIEGNLELDELTSMIEAIGYGVADESREQDNDGEFSLGLLLVTTALALPVFFLGMGFVDGGAAGPWIQLVLSTLVLATAGRNFYVRAYKLARNLETNMDSLVAVGTFAAYLLSLYHVFIKPGPLYFESAVVIINFVFLGKFIEHRAKVSTLKSVESLAKLRPKEAHRFRNYKGLSSQHDLEVCDSSSLQVDDVVLVRNGEAFPSDGTVLDGSSAVDAAMMTGESEPVKVDVGSEVIGGTINLQRPLAVKITRTGQETALAQIIRLVEESQNSKPPIQKLADRVAGRFVPVVFVLAALTFLAWVVLGYGYEPALIAAVSVLVISCPCAMGLATPMALVAASGTAARLGILIKDLASLEVLHRCQVIVFDKTGTLTVGKPQVVHQHYFTSNWQRELVNQILVTMEKQSTHPLAKAIVAAMGEAHGALEVSDLQESAGVGLSAWFHDSSGAHETFVGKVDAEEIENSQEWQKLLQDYPGTSVVGVKVDEQWVAACLLADPLRDDAKDVIHDLRKAGIEPIMASGDREATAQSVASTFTPGLRAYGAMSPEQKAELLQSIKKDSKVVAMVGDGINDAPALVEADVGVAMGSGSDVAIESAPITINSPSIGKIYQVFRLSLKTFGIIKQNLAWAFLYNIVLIPFAAFGLLSPMLASGAMAASSLCVVFNGMRLLRFR